MTRGLFLFVCLAGVSAAATLSISSSTTLPTGEINTPYSFTFTAAGGTRPYTWTVVGTMPAGFSLDPASGIFSGTPSSTSPISFTVQLADHVGASVQAAESIAVVGPPVLPPTIEGATVGEPYAINFKPTGGGGAPYTMSISGLPSGIALTEPNFKISGSTSSPGNYPLAITVTDSLGGQLNTNAYTLVVNPFPSFPGPFILTAPVNVVYSTKVAVSGGTGVNIIVLSGLPVGLKVASDGTITGTPTQTGSFDMVLQDTDNWNARVTGMFTINVQATLTISPTSISSLIVKKPFSVKLQASNAVAPTVWTSTGALPPGLTLNANGQLAGTPTAAGVYTPSVTVVDSTNATATQTLTLMVAAKDLQYVASLPDAFAGVPYSKPILISGGFPPYQVTVNSPLAGLTFNPANYTFSGTPTTIGPYSTTISITDSQGNSLTNGSLTLLVRSMTGFSITTSSPLPNGVLGLPYSLTFTTSNALPGPIAWSVLSGTLPVGLTLDPVKGILSGTPTVMGPNTFQIQAVDSGNNTTNSAFSLTITPTGVVITTTMLPLSFGGNYSPPQLMATGGTTPYTWSLDSGKLPTGLTLSTDGFITGSTTPKKTPSSTLLVFMVTDSATPPNTAQATLTLFLAMPLVLTSSTFDPAKVPFLAPSGGFPPYTCAITQGTLPTGLTLSSQCQFTEQTPPTGTYVITVQVTDTMNDTTTGVETLTVPPPGPLNLIGQTLPTADLGYPYSQTLRATGGTPPLTYAVTSGALPAGIMLSTAGVLTGTPTMTALTQFSVTVTDSLSVTATAAYSLPTKDGLSMTTTSPLPSGEAGVTYSQTLVAAKGIPPYQFAIAKGALPAGLTLNASSGTISGIPTTSGASSFTVALSDSLGTIVNAEFALTITGGLTIQPPPPLTGAMVSTPYSVQFSVQGVPPYVWQLSGTTPPGINFDPARALLSGTPTNVGSYSFTISCTDAGGQRAANSYTLAVAKAGPLALTTQPPLPVGIVRSAYSFPFVASGGVTPYTWAITAGALPAGLTLGATSGTVSGTPTTIGPSAFTVTVSDHANANVSGQYTIQIAPPGLQIVPPVPVPAAVVGTAYSLTLQLSDATPPVQWSLDGGALPGGLTLGATTGIISGTPAAAGSFSATVKAVDSANQASTATIVIQVDAAGTALANTTETTLQIANEGLAYSFTLKETGGHAPFAWSISMGALPTGLTLDPAAGLIKGVPTAIGVFALTVVVTDATGSTAAAMVTLEVEPPGPYFTAAGVVNAAGYQGGAVSPGELVVLFGLGLGPQTLAPLVLDGQTVSTSIGTAKVYFNSYPAPLIYSQDHYISAVVPWEVAGLTTTQIYVSYNGKTSSTVAMPVVDAVPGIFTLDESGEGQGAVINQDGTLNGPDHPAPKGSVIAVYATGGGKTNPASVDGALAASPLPAMVLAVIGGINNAGAEVTYAGPAPTLVSGVIQVNIRIPMDAASGASVPLSIKIGKVYTQKNVTVAIQ